MKTTVISTNRRVVGHALTLILAGSLTASALGQARIISADRDWQELAAAEAELKAPTNVRSAEADAQRDSKKKETKERAKKTQGKAATFTAAFGNDRNARKASKIQVLAALKAVGSGDDDSEKDALKQADAFRADRNNSAEDRFEIAWIAERRKLTDSNGKNANRDNSAALAKLLDKLYDECGDAGNLYATYQEVLRNADMETAYKVAKKIQSLPAPPYLKDAASAELTRYSLKNRAVQIALTTADGKPVNLAAGKGKTTMVVFTDGAGALTLGPAGRSSKVQFVHVIADVAYTRPAQAAPNAIECIEPKGLDGPVCKAFGVTRLPFVIVLDSNGKVSSYGHGGQMADLITGATQ